jgi:hypothetical protein
MNIVTIVPFSIKLYLADFAKRILDSVAVKHRAESGRGNHTQGAKWYYMVSCTYTCIPHMTAYDCIIAFNQWHRESPRCACKARDECKGQAGGHVPQ